MFSAENAKKNVKGKVTLSDGASKMLCMVPDKVHNLMVAAGAGEIRQYDIWVLNAGKQMVQSVQNKKVMVLRTAPEVYGRQLTAQIGAPQDYSRNVESGSFPSYIDLKIPNASATVANFAAAHEEQKEP